MKRFVTISTIALLGVAALSSCKKEYTCVCNETYSYGTWSHTTESTEDFRTTRNDAHDRCTDKTETSVYPVPGIGVVAVEVVSDCELR